jgi:hypothetical protein
MLDDRPVYRDLADVALTMVTTFQVSATDPTARKIRRTAIDHTRLPYLFGASDRAITITFFSRLMR